MKKNEKVLSLDDLRKQEFSRKNYYVKRVTFDLKTGKRFTDVVLCTKHKAIALGVCKNDVIFLVESINSSCCVSVCVYEGKSLLVKFDTFISENFK